MEALSSTHYVKSIITAETPMDLERKKEQSFQGDMYVRFMAFSNGDLEALYDKSEGFFAQFASTDCPFRMSGAGSSVEAVWFFRLIYCALIGVRFRIFLPFISSR